jgi:hypothetical protein
VVVHAESTTTHYAELKLTGDSNAAPSAEAVLQVYNGSYNPRLVINPDKSNFLGKGLVVGSSAIIPNEGVLLTADYAVFFGGVYSGLNADPGTGNVAYSGDLRRHDGTSLVTGYIYVPLPNGSTHSSWNGTAKSDGSGSISLTSGWSTNLPSGVKAIAVQLIAEDSVAAPAADLYLTVGANATYFYALSCRPIGTTGGNGIQDENAGVVPIEGDTLNYAINASGSSTMLCWIRIWGYWI